MNLKNIKKEALNIVLFFLLISIIAFSFIIPKALFYSNIKSVVNHEISTGKILNKAANNKTRAYLKSHKKVSVETVSDFQGSNNRTGYLVTGLTDDSALGVFVKFNQVGPYLTNYQIMWVQWND